MGSILGGSRQSTRADPFFDAVYEDGVRVQHEGRLLPLPYAHVLSPAHDLTRHINGPLLEAVRDGHNAMLLVCIPSSGGEGDGDSSRHGPRRSPASIAAGNAAGRAECAEIATELYASLLPLLFRSAPTCGSAAVSVVTASAHDRNVIDELQAPPPLLSSADASNCRGGRRVRSLKEVTWATVERGSSASQWGTIFGILADRHAGLTQEEDEDGSGGSTASSPSSSLAAQTACVVTVQLEDGYGRLVIVDCGCDQALLQALTLILGASATSSGGGSGRPRAYPPRTPLLTLLQENVLPPACAVHIVAVPNPAAEPRTSLRVMRFASDAAFASGPPPPVTAAAAAATAPPRPLPTPRSATPSDQPANRSTSVGRSRIASAMAATPAPLPPAPVPAQPVAAAAPPPVAAPPAATHADLAYQQQQGREQMLVARVTALEAQLRDLTAQSAAVHAAREHVERRVGSLQAALREKQAAFAASQEGTAKLKAESAHYRELVPKLLGKISGLERRRGELAAAQATRDKDRKAAEEAAKGKDDIIATLNKQVLALERRETQRVRLSNLQRMSTSLNAGATDPAAGNTNTNTSNSNTNTATGSPAKVRVAGVAIEELRRRNRELERSLHRSEHDLQQLRTGSRSGNNHAAQGSGDCGSCRQLLEERLAYFMNELAHTRKEKDELVRAVVSKDASGSGGGVAAVRDVSSGGVVQMLVCSLLDGCASLIAQLEAILAAVEEDDVCARRHGLGRHGTLSAVVDSAMVAEHIGAVRAVARSVAEIGSRQCSTAAPAGGRHGHRMDDSGELAGSSALVTSSGTIPHTATAADVGAFTTLLSFEAERAIHLRAFLPTFAQLAAATEHMHMRVKHERRRQKF